ncbi:MAG: DUF4430 domain-containing protein [Candidatus Hodarchaeota archaeon]
MDKKLTVLISVPFLLLGVALLLFGGPLIKQSLDNAQTTSIQVHLIIDYQGYAPNEEYTLNLPSNDNTVYDAMILANISMEKTGTGSLLFIEAINGIQNNQDGNNRWWQYWIDGELAPVGAGSYKLYTGAVVEWRYTHPQMS